MTSRLIARRAVEAALGLSRTTVERLVAAGRLVSRGSKGRGTLFDPDEVAALARSLAREREERTSSPTNDVKVERALLLKVQRERQSLDLAQRHGELVEIVGVETSWKQALHTIRENVMNLPSVLTQAGLISATDEAAVEEFCADALRLSAKTISPSQTEEETEE